MSTPTTSNPVFARLIDTLPIPLARSSTLAPLLILNFSNILRRRSPAESALSLTPSREEILLDVSRRAAESNPSPSISFSIDTQREQETLNILIASGFCDRDWG